MIPSQTKMMENNNYFKDLKNELVDYGKTRLELAKLVTYEKASRVTAFVFSFLLICFFLFFTLIFMGFMAGYYLGALTGNLTLGFGIVALINLTLLLLIIVFRKTLIEKPVINQVIRILMEGDTDGQDK